MIHQFLLWNYLHFLRINNAQVSRFQIQPVFVNIRAGSQLPFELARMTSYALHLSRPSNNELFMVQAPVLGGWVRWLYYPSHGRAADFEWDNSRDCDHWIKILNQRCYRWPLAKNFSRRQLECQRNILIVIKRILILSFIFFLFLSIFFLFFLNINTIDSIIYKFCYFYIFNNCSFH